LNHPISFDHASDLARYDPEQIRWAIEQLPPGSAQAILKDWHFWARKDQLPPPTPWSTWVLLGGRGSGKTRAGAEWVRGLMEQTVLAKPLRVALVAPTLHDAREVMIEGDSGLRAICPRQDRPKYSSSRRMLKWKNGNMAQVFSAEEADRLRGPQFDAAWADEFCAWKDPAHCLAMLKMGLRLGEQPKLVVTTTPRPGKPLQDLLAQPDVVLSRATTWDNQYLSSSFLRGLEAVYGNSALSRQELGGEILAEYEDGLWSRSQIEQAISVPPHEFERIVVAVDPPAGAGEKSAACGIIVAGLVGERRQGKAWVLADRTVQGLHPSGWAEAVGRAYEEFEADRVVAEANQGGEMVRTVLQLFGAELPITLVHARRAKRVRAEPVAALYEQGRVFHACPLPELEDQMCQFGSSAMSASPDRLDALVWAIWSLLLVGLERPRMRVL
jgi:phage terminase large subunit-like protein